MRCCGNHLECIVQSWNFGAGQSDISSGRSEKIKVWNAVVLNFNGWKNWVPKTVQFRLFLVIWSHSCMEFEEKNTYQYADVSVASNIRTRVLDVASVKSCVICYSAKSGWNSCCTRVSKKANPRFDIQKGSLDFRHRLALESCTNKGTATVVKIQQL